MDFSNREIAAGIWLLALFLSLLVWRTSRPSLLQLLRLLVRPPFTTVFSWATLYILACVWLMQGAGMWNWANLKTTVLWALTFAAVAIFSANRIDEDRTYFAKTLREILSLTVLLVFLTELHSFKLIVELIMLPVMALLSLMYAMSERDPAHAQVRQLMGCLIGGVGLSYLTYSLIETVRGWGQFSVVENLRELIIPIELSLMFLPFLYALSILMVYQDVFNGLDWAWDDPKLRRFAIPRAIAAFGWNLDLLKRWRRLVMMEKPGTRRDVRQSLRDTKRLYHRELNPPPADPSKGWSPYAATIWLSSFGVEMEDYHKGLGRYVASSRMLKLSKGVFGNHILYLVEGDELHATQVVVELTVDNLVEAGAADSQFAAMIVALVNRAIGTEGLSQFEQLCESSQFDMQLCGFGVKMEFEQWSLKSHETYQRTFTITHAAHIPDPDWP